MITPMTVLARLRDRLSKRRAAEERRRASMIDADEAELSEAGRHLRRLAIHDLREEERRRHIGRSSALH